MEKGLLVFVYRHGSDCSNNGISSKHDQLILVGDGVPEIFEVSDKTPALKLVKRVLFGKDAWYATPVNPPKGCIGPMSGGNFIYSCDSRFPSEAPIAIHDRFETSAQYERLSR